MVAAIERKLHSLISPFLLISKYSHSFLFGMVFCTQQDTMSHNRCSDSASQLFLETGVLFQDWEARGVTQSKMLPSTGQTQEYT